MSPIFGDIHLMLAKEISSFSDTCVTDKLRVMPLAINFQIVYITKYFNKVRTLYVLLADKVYTLCHKNYLHPFLFSFVGSCGRVRSFRVIVLWS